jgi:PAS domain S-box-containing protein
MNGGSSLKDTVIRINEMLCVLNSRSLFTLDRADIGLFECDRSGMCTFANSAMSNIFGLAQEELKGNGWLQAIDENERYEVWDAWHKMIEDNIPYDTTYLVINRDSKKRFQCRSTAKPHFDSRKGILGYIGVIEATEIQNAA